jgi:putative transposase
MPQSLSKVILHLIFSTKERQPWLDSDVRPRVHGYLATICHDLGADIVHVDGFSDHVHVVTTLPRTLSQAQLIRADEEDIFEMDQSARCSLSRMFLAARVWRVFSEPESTGGRVAIR